MLQRLKQVKLLSLLVDAKICGRTFYITLPQTGARVPSPSVAVQDLSRGLRHTRGKAIGSRLLRTCQRLTLEGVSYKKLLKYVHFFR